MNFTFEADRARKGLINYNTAIQRTYVTRTRFQLAKPYSVIVLGHCHGWSYNEGLLAYPLGNLIRILDVYNAAVTEDVIDLKSLLGEEAKRWPPYTQRIQKLLSEDLDIRVFGHGGGILLIGIDDYDSPPGYLVVIDIRKEVLLQERLLMIRRCSYDCVAKTDGRYIIVFEDPQRNGNLDLYDLEDKQQRIQKLHLPKCINYYNADRQIYDGWFYLLTNVLSPGDGITSKRQGFTCCYSFPLNQLRQITSYCTAGAEPLPEQLQVVRVRGQQPRTRENNGPDPRIPWSSLTLWRDEYSRQLVIVEGWHHDGEEDDAATAQYTFQPVQFPEPNSAIDTATPDNEFYLGGPIQTLNPADLPRAEKDCECPRDPGDRLKARCYVPRASTFFDVYLASNENPDSKRGFEFHLAVGSRDKASPSESQLGQVDKNSSQSIGEFSPHDDGKRKFIGVRRFPPNGAPKALLDLLCPTGEQDVDANSSHDPRTILYSTKRLHRKFKDNAHQLVLINFDPWIRFPGLEPMKLDPLSTQMNPREYEDELASARKDQRFFTPEELDAEWKAEQEAERVRNSEMDEADKVEEVWEPKPEWFWNERAMYLDIGQGFQFS